MRAPDSPATMPPVVSARRPIRVGFAIHVMQVAGAEVLIEETIRRLGPAIEPTILCLDAIGTIGERLIARGVPVICLNRKAGRDWGVARRMAAEIKQRRIQVMHAHQYTPFFYSALAKLWCGGSFRLIQTEHGRHYPDIVNPKRRFVNRLFLDKLADETNACCHFSAKALCRNDGFVGSKIGVIENGVELSRYRPDRDVFAAKRLIGLDPARRHVGCVARFHPVKDHAMLMRAFIQLAAKLPDVDLVLAGEGQLRPNLEKQAADAGITHRVKFLGVRSDVPDVLAALDLFALTSVSEAASLTLMEAMATARPSVVTNVGGNPELVRNGLDGLLVPRGDSAACAEAMGKILSDPALATKMGQSARQRAETTFNLDVTVRAYHDLYVKLTR
ncbi:glycosyltransferase [Zavarzinella formosa]|uniref:glycosyltransferase n=1 Tax=Zavarzinella formosa TaxID=360055 RepID=UPI0003662779|nr:glycosyltransferase [Zavarzinella formosa]